MIPCYGVEIVLDNKKGTEYDKLLNEITESVTVIDHDSTVFITRKSIDRDKLITLTKELNLFEDEYQLIHINKHKHKLRQSDYGFLTENSNLYLFADLVVPFTIKEGNTKEIEMAALQMDEHVITSDGSIYFVDVNQKELIDRIAHAYEVTLTFFDLDKCEKNN